jgi:hypothetical protein
MPGRAGRIMPDRPPQAYRQFCRLLFKKLVLFKLIVVVV